MPASRLATYEMQCGAMQYSTVVVGGQVSDCLSVCLFVQRVHCSGMSIAYASRCEQSIVHILGASDPVNSDRDTRCTSMAGIE